MAANGRKYGFSGSITGAASKTIVGVTATSAVRPYLTDVMISSNATPADNSSEWQVLRYTAAGTSTAVTPTAYDSGDPACTSTAGKNHTVEPTYSPSVPLLDIAHNQRATFRWIAGPGEEIISPATAANGLGVQCQGIGRIGRRGNRGRSLWRVVQASATRPGPFTRLRFRGSVLHEYR
jgi:hypothetical protein